MLSLRRERGCMLVISLITVLLHGRIVLSAKVFGIPQFASVPSKLKNPLNSGFLLNFMEGKKTGTGPPLNKDDYLRAAKLPDKYFKLPQDPTIREKLLKNDIRGRNLFDLENKNLPVPWPNATIPYRLSVKYSLRYRSIIAKSIQLYHNETCIRFIPWTTESQYVTIFPGEGCYSNVGQQMTPQIVSLGRGCDSVPFILHELMHTLGFDHEQSRSDRDEYIEVKWENIQPTYRREYRKIESGEGHLLGPYDYGSLMHYESTDFGIDKSKPTMVNLKKLNITLGGALTFTEHDISKINKLYKCVLGKDGTMKVKSHQ